MDDRESVELEKLFADAPGEPPPSTFTADDVAAASRRATARRRRTVAGVAAAVVLVGGAGSAAVFALRPAPDGDTVAAASAPPESSRQPRGTPARPLDGPGIESFPSDSRKQGQESDGKPGPRTGSTARCEKGDRELATALAGELPAAARLERAEHCADGTRRARFAVPGGAVTATVLPEGVALRPPSGGEHVERRLSGGRTVSVSTEDSPRVDDLGAIADALVTAL